MHNCRLEIKFLYFFRKQKAISYSSKVDNRRQRQPQHLHLSFNQVSAAAVGTRSIACHTLLVHLSERLGKEEEEGEELWAEDVW